MNAPSLAYFIIYHQRTYPKHTTITTGNHVPSCMAMAGPEITLRIRIWLWKEQCFGCRRSVQRSKKKKTSDTQKFTLFISPAYNKISKTNKDFSGSVACITYRRTTHITTQTSYHNVDSKNSYNGNDAKVLG